MPPATRIPSPTKRAKSVDQQASEKKLPPWLHQDDQFPVDASRLEGREYWDDDYHDPQSGSKRSGRPALQQKSAAAGSSAPPSAFKRPLTGQTTDKATVSRSASTRKPATQPSVPNARSVSENTSESPGSAKSHLRRKSSAPDGSATAPITASKSTGSAHAHTRSQSMRQQPIQNDSPSNAAARVSNATSGARSTISTVSKLDGRTISGSILNGSSSTKATPSKSTSRDTTPRTSSAPRAASSSTPQSSNHARSSSSTHQQSYTPKKQSAPQMLSTGPPSVSKNADKLAPASTSSQSSSAGPELPQIRNQIQLMQLSLLHAGASDTFASTLSSAEAELRMRFDALHVGYTRALLLEREVRQTRNLQALHAWSGGNIAALTRKLNVLTSVLADLTVLTEPGGGQGEAGAYTKCIERFQTWTSWVRGVWMMRDAEGSFDDPQGDANNAAALSTENSARIQIEGFDDSTKATLRALSAQVNAIALRLRDLDIPIPDANYTTASPATPVTAGAAPTSKQPAASSTTPTPLTLLSAAQRHVASMQDELQMIREIEYEVLVGEQAWLELRRMKNEF